MNNYEKECFSSFTARGIKVTNSGLRKNILKLERRTAIFGDLNNTNKFVKAMYITEFSIVDYMEDATDNKARVAAGAWRVCFYLPFKTQYTIF